jgi:hypothetical protein
MGLHFLRVWSDDSDVHTDFIWFDLEQLETDGYTMVALTKGHGHTQLVFIGERDASVLDSEHDAPIRFRLALPMAETN